MRGPDYPADIVVDDIDDGGSSESRERNEGRGGRRERGWGWLEAGRDRLRNK